MKNENFKGTANDARRLLLEKLRRIDAVLGTIGMTLNVGNDENNEIVYRIESNPNSDMVGVVKTVAESSNGTIVESLMVDITVKGVTEESDPANALQKHVNAAFILDEIAKMMTGMFRTVASIAVENNEILEELNSGRGNIARIVELARAALKNKQKGSDSEYVGREFFMSDN